MILKSQMRNDSSSTSQDAHLKSLYRERTQWNCQIQQENIYARVNQPSIRRQGVLFERTLGFLVRAPTDIDYLTEKIR